MSGCRWTARHAVAAQTLKVIAGPRVCFTPNTQSSCGKQPSLIVSLASLHWLRARRERLPLDRTARCRCSDTQSHSGRGHACVPHRIHIAAAGSNHLSLSHLRHSIGSGRWTARHRVVTQKLKVIVRGRASVWGTPHTQQSRNTREQQTYRGCARFGSQHARVRCARHSLENTLERILL